MSVVESKHLVTVREYLAALERGVSGDDLARFFTADARQIEWPNRLNPTGGESDLPTLRKRAEQARNLIRTQHFEIRSAFAQGQYVAVEARWTATLAAPVASLPAGATMTAHFAMFFEFSGDRICLQRNYDCFDPW